jgi:hypothetical protein
MKEAMSKSGNFGFSSGKAMGERRDADRVEQATCSLRP